MKRKMMSMVLCMALLAGIGSSVTVRPAKAQEQQVFKQEAAAAGQTATGAASDAQTGTDLPATGAAVDTSKIKLSKSSAILMAGKKKALTISGTESAVTWTSENIKVATVSAAGKVKGVKKGSTVIHASVDGITLNCKVTVVAKMAKKDFGKFSSENFVSYCQRKSYDKGKGYAWQGQWKGDSKKKSTYRKIKIGATKKKVQKAYGELTWKKCTSKDPFTLMKGLKKNKVKKYADVTYGKYRIRFYLNKSSKVVAIIYACNISKIKKKALRSYI